MSLACLSIGLGTRPCASPLARAHSEDRIDGSCIRKAALDEPLDPELGAALMDAASSASFAPLLLATARRFEPVEEIFAYSAVGSCAPEELLSSSSLEDAGERAARYAKSFHKDDPAATTWRRIESGHGFVQRVRSAEITQADYRAICFERPAFVDKTCFGWRGENQSLVLSFYRRTGGHEDPERRLSAIADLALTALVRRAPQKQGGVCIEDRLEARLGGCFPKLSARERQVCARTIAGWTANEIADQLQVRPATVLTYRQRAYQRFGFSKASQFLAGLLD